MRSYEPSADRAPLHDDGVNLVLEGAYQVAGHLARSIAAVAPASESKLVATFHARRGIIDRYTQFARTGRQPDRVLLWMHAASVGEGLMALPVIRALRSARCETSVTRTR